MTPLSIEAAVGGKAKEAFAYLESRAPKEISVGADLTIADLAIVSNLLLFHYLGRRIDPAFPKLLAYFKRHIYLRPIREALDVEAAFAEQMGLDRSFTR